MVGEDTKETPHHCGPCPPGTACSPGPPGISKLNFKNTTYEPCLYRGEIDGDSVFLLRQVDDFSVASPSEAVANVIFSILQANLKQPLKLLGLLSMYNRIDISQSNRFVKVSCATYLRKILEGHGW